MPYIPGQQINTGSFVGTTNVWESQITDANVNSPEFKRLLVELHRNIGQIALVLNTKETGYYILEEFVTGQLYFNPNDPNPNNLRPAFRKEINLGALGAGVTSVNHGLAITNTWKFAKIVGAASNTGTRVYYALPNSNITVSVTATQVVINNASGVTFTDAYIDLEYVKF